MASAPALTYLSFDLATGKYLGRLPFTNVTFGSQLLTPGTFSGTLDFASQAIQNLGPLSATAPARTVIAIDYMGALIFSQRCAGCHTLSYAGTHGSASNVRTAQPNNGPNFNVRCERPVSRVLYAIENGGFSGVVMPQNIVVGQQARDVAQFVAKVAGKE